jgi:hypothetical protein
MHATSGGRGVRVVVKKAEVRHCIALERGFSIPEICVALGWAIQRKHPHADTGTATGHSTFEPLTPQQLAFHELLVSVEKPGRYGMVLLAGDEEIARQPLLIGPAAVFRC